MILGKPWLATNNPYINWRTNHVTLDHENAIDSKVIIKATEVRDVMEDDENFLPCRQNNSKVNLNLIILALIVSRIFSMMSYLHLGHKFVVLIEFGLLRDLRQRIGLHTDLVLVLEVDSQIAQFLEKKMIRLSVSPYGARVLLVKKKDGSLRMCIDNRLILCLMRRR